MYKCSLCDKHFYSLVDCEKHQEAAHTDGEAELDTSTSCVQVNFRCSYCGVAFGHWSDVKNHSLRDHGQQRVEVTEFTV